MLIWLKLGYWTRYKKSTVLCTGNCLYSHIRTNHSLSNAKSAFCMISIMMTHLRLQLIQPAINIFGTGYLYTTKYNIKYIPNYEHIIYYNIYQIHSIAFLRIFIFTMWICCWWFIGIYNIDCIKWLHNKKFKFCITTFWRLTFNIWYKSKSNQLMEWCWMLC